MAPECPKQADPLFFYTSGRWLWNEDKQLQERFRYFLVPELQEAGRHAVGASRCLAITKIGEGNLNKAYRLEMDDGQIVVGKIPHPNAGPSFFTTASEVATMEYARSVLGLPVPKVLAWSASDNNPVGAEYIIMEEAKGTQLNRVWDDLPLKFRCDILRQVVDIESRLLSVSFQQIGSLYFKDSNVPGCMPAAPTAGSQKIVDQISSRFCLGPIARREFWENERAHMSQHQGPWTSASEYMVSVAQREMEWINLYGSSQLDSSLDVSKQFQFISSNQNSPDVHISALERYISAVPHLIPRDPTMTCPRFWHPDFHAGNIFIDEQNRISSIIDCVERRLFFPDNFKTLNEDEKNEIRYQVSQSILINSYETATAKINPVIHQKLHHPAGKTLKQLETFAGGSWDNCIFPLIECLLHVKRNWEVFNQDEPCPYQFSDEELHKHYDEVEQWNASRDYWGALDGILDDEGYTQNDTYKLALEAVTDMRRTQKESQSDSDSDSDFYFKSSSNAHQPSSNLLVRCARRMRDSASWLIGVSVSIVSCVSIPRRPRHIVVQQAR